MKCFGLIIRCKKIKRTIQYAFGFTRLVQRLNLRVQYNFVNRLLVARDQITNFLLLFSVNIFQFPFYVGNNYLKVFAHLADVAELQQRVDVKRVFVQNALKKLNYFKYVTM
jgi:hypothetical protein